MEQDVCRSEVDYANESRENIQMLSQLWTSTSARLRSMLVESDNQDLQ